MNHLKNICFATSLALLLAFPAATFASEKTYQVTETELTQLERNLTELKTVNDKQKQDSEKLKTALTESQARLETAKEESVRQSEALAELRKRTSEQETLLKKANQSLAAYAKEEKKEKKRIRLQRDLAWCLAAVAVGAYIVKK